MIAITPAGSKGPESKGPPGSRTAPKQSTLSGDYILFSVVVVVVFVVVSFETIVSFAIAPVSFVAASTPVMLSVVVSMVSVEFRSVTVALSAGASVLRAGRNRKRTSGDNRTSDDFGNE